MPTYQYRCAQCGEQFEARQSIHDDTLTVHESCGGALSKVFAVGGIVLKGPGFYRNDSRSKAGGNKGDRDSSSTAASGNGSGDSKTTSDSGSKSESSKSESSNSESSNSESSKSETASSGASKS